MNRFLAIICVAFTLNVHASSPTGVDVNEIRLSITSTEISQESQAVFRTTSYWSQWEINHPGWIASMSAKTGLPHRAWGSAITVNGAGVESKHDEFVVNELTLFGIDKTQLSDDFVFVNSGSHSRVFQTQTISGYPVLFSQVQTKWKDGKLVMWGLDWWSDAEVPVGDLLVDEVISTIAIGDIIFDDLSLTFEGWAILPDSYAEGEFRLVRKMMLKGKVDGLVRNYETWVDAISGRVWYRKNNIVHHLGKKTTVTMGLFKNPVYEPMATAELITELFTQPVISGQMNGLGHASYPFEASEQLGMPHLQLFLDGQTYYTDENGGFITNLSSAVMSANIELKGKWSHVYTNNVTPSVLLDFENGYNILSVPGNPKEVSAFRSVNLIHDHMRSWLVNFDGLDFPLTTNIDVEGECNAYFDGNSINFYDTGGGCNPTSLIADVVYHEYGHGINTFYYSSLGAGFYNGAMGEGYADIWGMSLADIAEIGMGFYEDNNDGIRRYDAEPKVYPQDLVGEVHADGEIIAGAWYDTHLLLGGDWDLTMSLFVDAYAGLQATAPDGDEGQAFTDVLLDVLQADDDDDDLLNGTPNALAIIEGFAIHGITLFSYATVDHYPVEFSQADELIEIEAEVDIVFPYSLYFEGVYLSYRTLYTDSWTEVLMDQNDEFFTSIINGLPAGTVVEYYIKIKDVFGGVSGVTPMASDFSSNANLPFYIVVGSYPYLINDSDDYADFGNWEMGLPTDNATTGEWEETIPVGSYGEAGNPSSIVAVAADHTVGFAGYCFLTGVSPGSSAGIGENDVDGGHTTLESPVIDLTIFDNPVMTYWRWYVNAPSTGANPGADWWQVQISSDGGSNWQYLENTLQQDMSWRRKAFRVADYVELTDEFQMRFIASDSTTVGEYLDGGSLIEAALDDIILYDVVPHDDATNDIDDYPALSVSPNPSSSFATLNFALRSTPVRVYDMVGALVFESMTSANGTLILDISSWNSGVYTIELRDRKAVRQILRLEVIR